MQKYIQEELNTDSYNLTCQQCRIPSYLHYSSAASTFFSSSSFAKEPSWCIDIRMSQPPINSLSTYS